MLAVVIPSGLTALILAFIVQILLTGLLAAVVGRSVLGGRTTAGDAWRIARPRLPALLLATLLAALALIGPWAGLAAVLILLGAAGAPGELVIAVLLLGAIACVVADVWFWTMFSMSAAAVVLERRGPAQALGRSWRRSARASGGCSASCCSRGSSCSSPRRSCGCPSRSSPRRSPPGPLPSPGDQAERGQPR
jgi:hypothetical protein